MAPHGNRRVGILNAEPRVGKNRMSRGRLSDCSGSTTGKMEVRVLTHSQAVGSACERRESIARARGLSTPSALSRRAGSGGKKTPSRSRGRRPRPAFVAVRTETVHGLRNDRGMPVFTPGSNPRRLPAAAHRRGSRFLSSSHRDAETKADGGAGPRRAAGARTCIVSSSRFRAFHAHGRCYFRDGVLAASVRERGRKGGDGQTRAEPSETAAHDSRRKKNIRARARLVRRSSRSGQKRITGRVMAEECPCSPREATLGASPRRRTAAGRACVSIIPRRTDPGGGARRNECRCSFRGSSASRTSRPRRGTPHECGPLSKRAPIAGVLRPLLQVTFCERAANETRVAISRDAFAENDKKTAGAAAARLRRRRRRPGTAEVFFSRKMVNVLNVDRHRQSVAWIKLCIIENVVRIPRTNASGSRVPGPGAGGGRRADWTDARRERDARASRVARFRTN